MNPASGLALARLAVGASALAAPRLSARLFRLDADSPTTPYLLRLFGSREVVLGALTLAAPAPLKPAVVAAGVAVDSSDAAAGVLAARNGEVDRPTGALLAAPAVLAVAAGVAGLVLSRRGS